MIIIIIIITVIITITSWYSSYLSCSCEVPLQRPNRLCFLKLLFAEKDLPQSLRLLNSFSSISSELKDDDSWVVNNNNKYITHLKSLKKLHTIENADWHFSYYAKDESNLKTIKHAAKITDIILE